MFAGDQVTPKGCQKKCPLILYSEHHMSDLRAQEEQRPAWLCGVALKACLESVTPRGMLHHPLSAIQVTPLGFAIEEYCDTTVCWNGVKQHLLPLLHICQVVARRSQPGRLLKGDRIKLGWLGLQGSCTAQHAGQYKQTVPLPSAS